MSDLKAPEAGLAATETHDNVSTIAEAEGLTIATRSFGRQTWDRFRRHKVAMFSAVVLIFLTISFFVVPTIYEFDPTFTDVPNRKLRPTFENFPNWLFGTDDLGRSLFIRTFAGGQISIQIALTVAMLTTVIGTVIGATAGYLGGKVDTLLSQLTNLFLVVPLLVVLLVIATADIAIGPLRFDAGSVGSISFILAVFSWPSISRVVRGLFLQYKEREFVLAAQAAGASSRRIMFRHILPNAFGPIIVNTTLLIGAAIILESTLSFLGLGIQPPTPSLGLLVAEAKGKLDSDPAALLFPAAFVVAISLCINFLGDGLRDALDPTAKK